MTAPTPIPTTALSSAVCTTCAYCGVGCGIKIEGDRLEGDSLHPANRGALCVKGATLLETMAHIDGIERIRFTTSHPNHFTDRLINAFDKVPQLVNHLHLPVQSGSDRILSAMKRGYTAQEYLRIIEKLKAIRPNLAMSSDFIVGFPGETHEDFLDTMRLIDAVKFDVSFSFIYSARPGTPAAELEDLVPYNEKLHRLQTLQAEIAQYAKSVSDSMVGHIEKVLVEGLSTRDPSELYGRTENNRIVNFKPPVGLANARQKLIGQMVDMRITQAMTNTLRGEVAMSAEQMDAFTPLPYSASRGFISIPIAQA